MPKKTDKDSTSYIIIGPRDGIPYSPSQPEITAGILRHSFRAEVVSFDSSDNYLEELLKQAEAKRTTYEGVIEKFSEDVPF